MRILCSCISNYNENIFINLMKLMPKDSFLYIYHYEYIFSKKLHNDCFIFNSGVGLSCEYNKLDEYDSIPPIDGDILDKMSKYEGIIFNMMERNSVSDYATRYYEYCEHIRYWNYILDKLDIKLFVDDVIPHGIYDYIIYCLCKIKGIKFVASFPSLFKGYSYLVDTIEDSNKKWIELYDELHTKYDSLHLDDIHLSDDFEKLWKTQTDIKKDLTPYYMKNVSKSSSVSIIDKTRIIKNRIKYITLCFLNLLCLNVEKVAKLYKDAILKSDIYREESLLYKYYEENSEEVCFSEGKKFIYFPLHLQPEATTSPMGGRYWDQIMCIKMMSFYLPQGYYIYVKEHPSQIKGCLSKYKVSRSVDYYKELKKIKNVKLISFKVNTFDLISNSMCVATVTGRAGFEALLYNKPCFVFGNSLLNYADGIHIIKTKEDCERAIFELINDNFCGYEKKELRVFFKFLEQVLYKGTIHPATENDMLSKDINDELVANAYFIKINEINFNECI